MVSWKKRARNAGSGKFASAAEPNNDKKKPRRKKAERVEALPEDGADCAVPERCVGRPKSGKKLGPVQMFEASITISVGGVDIDRALMNNVHQFLVEKALSGKCSLERGGTAYHLHIQMVARVEAATFISISRTLKSYLGWDLNRPAGAMVMCRKLTNKGLHTYHGLIGYCMKDSHAQHFQTIDHNITAEDVNLGLEQYALYGQEESKKRVVLTLQNIVDRVFMWRKFNCKHPLLVDFERDLYEMIKTGKYYPAPTWVIGGYGKGFELFRMQSLYKMMVLPHQISRLDVSNVFEYQDSLRDGKVTRKEWFSQRWEEDTKEVQKEVKPTRRDLYEEFVAMGLDSNSGKNMEILVEVAGRIQKLEKKEILEEGPCVAEASIKAVTRKGKLKVSQTHYLWPSEWNIDDLCYTSSSTEQCSGTLYTSVLSPAVYIPLYERKNQELLIS